MSRKDHGNSPSSPSKDSSSRYGSLARTTSGDRAQFGECLPGQLGAALDMVIGEGDLLSLSRTSDGGAICLYIKSGVETVKVYAVVQEDLDRIVGQLASGQ